jgi:hypothetical protein
MQAGVSTELVVATTPEASCTLHGPNGEEGSTLHLFADEAGNVRFHAKPALGIHGVATTLLDCATKDGATTSTVLEMESTPDAVVGDTVTQAVTGAAQVRVLRPALTASDYSLSSKELVARGYPAAPDRVKAPEAFAAWTKLTSQTKSALRVPSTHVLDTGNVHAPPLGVAKKLAPDQTDSFNAAGDYNAASDDSSKIWSGYVLWDWTTYSYIGANWTVPAVSGAIPAADSSTWVGLDGWHMQDVIQSGTAQDTAFEFIDCGGYCSGGIEIDTYYAWYEWYPANEHRLFDVAPGDSISTVVYAGDENGNITAFGPYMWFHITDNTTGMTQQQRVDKPSNAPDFTAYSAEFVQERPTLADKSHAPLANYGSVGFNTGFAFDVTNSTFHNVDTDQSLAVSMTSDDGSRILSTPWLVDGSTFGANWVGLQ